jgi:hypothetical protein
LRASETVSLKVSNIDGERGVIQVEHGKGGKDRNVMLSAQLLHILRVYWKLVRPQVCLFPGRDESKPIDVQVLHSACRSARIAAGMLNLNTFGRVVIVGTIALADRLEQPDSLRHRRRTLITRARIEGFLLDDHETALVDLLSWNKQGLLQTREDVMEGIETVPRAFIQMLKGENFGKQLVKL